MTGSGVRLHLSDSSSEGRYNRQRMRESRSPLSFQAPCTNDIRVFRVRISAGGNYDKMEKENVCECGHEEKWHSKGYLEFDNLEFDIEKRIKGIPQEAFCELPGCYFPGEESQTCPCKKFKFKKKGQL